MQLFLDFILNPNYSLCLKADVIVGDVSACVVRELSNGVETAPEEGPGSQISVSCHCLDHPVNQWNLRY